MHMYTTRRMKLTQCTSARVRVYVLYIVHVYEMCMKLTEVLVHAYTCECECDLDPYTSIADYCLAQDPANTGGDKMILTGDQCYCECDEENLTPCSSEKVDIDGTEYLKETRDPNTCECVCNPDLIAAYDCPNIPGEGPSIDENCECVPCYEPENEYEKCDPDYQMWDEQNCMCVCIDTPCPGKSTRKPNPKNPIPIANFLAVLGFTPHKSSFSHNSANGNARKMMYPGLIAFV